MHYWTQYSAARGVIKQTQTAAFSDSLTTIVKYHCVRLNHNEKLL